MPGEPLPAAVGHEQSDTWEGGWAAATDQVTDADRISPLAMPSAPTDSHRATIHLVLNTGLPLAEVRSPSHEISPTWIDDQVEVDFGVDGIPMDRDLVLQWAPIPGGAPSAALFRETHAGQQYLMMMVMPPALAETPSLPRELIFVIDRSGSMAGEPIGQAKAALLRGLDSLGPDDRFNIISFSDQAAALFPQAELASAAMLDRARRHLRAMAASGGTEMAAALDKAMASHPDQIQPSAVRQILFITDGAVGNEAALSRIHRGLGDSRLFMVGIGSAPNRHFLRKAAQFGRGSTTAIDSPDQVGVEMDALLTTMQSPMLADISLTWRGTGTAVHTRRPGDLYRDEPLVIAARMEQLGGQVDISGTRRDPHQPQWQATLDIDNAVPAPGIHRYWARQRIATLLDSRITGADPEAVEIAVRETALAHDLVSPYTSFLAIEHQQARHPDDPLQTESVPNLLPSGVAPAMAVMPQTATPGPLLVALGATGLLMMLMLLTVQRTGFGAQWRGEPA